MLILPKPKYRQSEFMLYATLKNKNWGKEDASWAEKKQDREQVRKQDTEQDKTKLILEFCEVPRSLKEFLQHLGLSSRGRISEKYLKTLL